MVIGKAVADPVATLGWPHTGGELRTVVIDEPGAGMERIYALTEPTLILVRPNGYIAALAPSSRLAAIGRFIEPPHLEFLRVLPGAVSAPA